jgi:hypothetical protein
MLRISNVAPVYKPSFDPLRHLRREDVRLVGNTLVIQLRWTKTLQRYLQIACIRLFQIPGSPVCPVAAFMAMNRSYSVMPCNPFLSYRVSGQICVITQAHLAYRHTAHGHPTRCGPILMQMPGTVLFSGCFLLFSLGCSFLVWVWGAFLPLFHHIIMFNCVFVCLAGTRFVF